MLEWIVTSSLLIVVVLVLRMLLCNRLSGRVRYALWGLVLLRLLIPVQLFAGPVSVGAYLPQTNIAAQEERTLYVLPVQEVPLEEAEREGLIHMEEGQVVSDADPFGYTRIEGDVVRRYAGKITPEDLVLWGWGSGCTLVLLVLLWSNLRFTRRLRRLRRPLKAENCPLPVYEAEGLPSPCLFGLFHPAVYVTPEAAADPMVLRHVLAHETTHYHQGDHIWSALRAAALALHWYNPLVWWAVIASKQDGELACDEGAIRVLGEGERQAYGETLLRLLTVKPSPRDLFACATTMTGDNESLRERFSRISCKRKTLVGISAAVIFAAAAAAVFLFSGGRDVPEKEDLQEDPNEVQADSGIRIPELALDVVTVEDTADGGIPRKTVLELPRFQDEEDPVLQNLNARMAKVKAYYDTVLSYNDDPDGYGNIYSATLYAYPCLGTNCISIVFFGQESPSYGTDGYVTSFCYDFVERKEISPTEALAASGWTEETIEAVLFDYIQSNIADYYAEEERDALVSNLEILGFRQGMDGGWDFFIQYYKPEAAATDWRFLFTFSDGTIKKGVAIPTKEILDIGCSLEDLSPYQEVTANEVIAGLKAEDIVYVDRDLGNTAELAAALRGAADHVTALQGEFERKWEAAIYLSGSPPERYDDVDTFLTIAAGPLENIVRVIYVDRPTYNHTAYVEDAALYTLLRESYEKE